MDYNIIYKTKNNRETAFTARLVGIINNEEARAILNTKRAPRAVFTSASLDPTANSTKIAGKRLVLASTTLKKNRKVILITPELSFVSFRFSGTKKSICYHTINHEEFAITTN